jgi:hypothetical protein
MNVKEVINHNRDMDDSKPDYGAILNKLFNGAKMIRQVTNNLFLYHASTGEYLLVLDNTTPISYLSLEQQDILGKSYPSLKMIATIPQQRNTKKASTLLFAVKEIVGPIVIDGALMKKRQWLVPSLAKIPASNLKILDKSTGKTSNYSGLINDIDKCYVLESIGLGFGKQLLPEGFDYTWYDFYSTDS